MTRSAARSPALQRLIEQTASSIMVNRDLPREYWLSTLDAIATLARFEGRDSVTVLPWPKPTGETGSRHH